MSSSEMPRIGGWEVFSSFLEKERTFYNDVVIPLGFYWDTAWLPAYTQDNRGYEPQAKELIKVLFGDLGRKIEKNEQKMNSEHIGYFERLEKITSDTLGTIGSTEKELRIMNKLREQYMKPTMDIIYEKVLEAENHRERLMLSPNEWIDVTNNLSCFLNYMNYRNGNNLIREWYFIEKKPLKSMIKKFGGPLSAFVRKWYGRFDQRTADDWGIVTYCSIDAYDNILLKVISSKNPRDILLNEIPENGINRVIFNFDREVMKNKMSEILERRTHKEDLSSANSLKIKLDKDKVAEYFSKLTGIDVKQLTKESGKQNHANYIS